MQAQRVPADRAAIEQAFHVGEVVAVDRLDLLARGKEQGAVAQVAQIDLVEDAVEDLKAIRRSEHLRREQQQDIFKSRWNV